MGVSGAAEFVAADGCRLCRCTAATPLGWPISWISLALAALIVAFSARMPPIIRAIAASAFLYGLSYLVVGVAIGMRYYFWTIAGAAIAVLALAVERRARGERIPRRTLIVAAGVVALPTLMAVGARLTLP